MTMPPFSWHHLNQWQFDLIPTTLMVIAGGAYLLGAHRVAHWPRYRSVLFFVGLVVTFLATESVLGLYDRAYFSFHMVQHLALIMVAAPMFALAMPLDLAHEAGPDWIRRFLDGALMKVITHPLFAFAVYFVFIPVTHLTSFFNLTLENEPLHNLEHVGFLVVGYLFFRAAFGLERGFTIHPGLRLVYVMAAVPVDTFTGLALAMSSHNPFPAYHHTAPLGSDATSILDNLHLGGAIMWIGGDALMLLACIPIAVAWVRWETVRTRELDRELDRRGL